MVGFAADSAADSLPEFSGGVVGVFAADDGGGELRGFCGCAEFFLQGGEEVAGPRGIGQGGDDEVVDESREVDAFPRGGGYEDGVFFGAVLFQQRAEGFALLVDEGGGDSLSDFFADGFGEGERGREDEDASVVFVGGEDGVGGVFGEVGVESGRFLVRAGFADVALVGFGGGRVGKDEFQFAKAPRLVSGDCVKDDVGAALLSGSGVNADGAEDGFGEGCAGEDDGAQQGRADLAVAVGGFPQSGDDKGGGEGAQGKSGTAASRGGDNGGGEVGVAVAGGFRPMPEDGGGAVEFVADVGMDGGKFAGDGGDFVGGVADLVRDVAGGVDRTRAVLQGVSGRVGEFVQGRAEGFGVFVGKGFGECSQEFGVGALVGHCAGLVGEGVGFVKESDAAVGGNDSAAQSGVGQGEGVVDDDDVGVAGLFAVGLITGGGGFGRGGGDANVGGDNSGRQFYFKLVAEFVQGFRAAFGDGFQAVGAGVFFTAQLLGGPGGAFSVQIVSAPDLACDGDVPFFHFANGPPDDFAVAVVHNLALQGAGAGGNQGALGRFGDGGVQRQGGEVGDGFSHSGGGFNRADFSAALRVGVGRENRAGVIQRDFHLLVAPLKGSSAFGKGGGERAAPGKQPLGGRGQLVFRPDAHDFASPLAGFSR